MATSLSWRDRGVWEAILGVQARHQQGRLRFIDAIYVRVNQSACNPVGGPAAQAIGPSRGGRTTKVHALVDGRGRALKLLLRAGNVVDITVAPVLVSDLDGSTCGTLVADKGYDSDGLRVHLRRRGVSPCLSLHPRRLAA